MDKSKKMDFKVGVGTDIEDVRRFEKKLGDKNFLKGIFTDSELRYCFSKVRPAEHLTARFAGKESVVKALGSLGAKAYTRRVEIVKMKNGAPKVRLLDKGLDKKFRFSISISHSKEKAIAVAIAFSL